MQIKHIPLAKLFGSRVDAAPGATGEGFVVAGAVADIVDGLLHRRDYCRRKVRRGEGAGDYPCPKARSSRPAGPGHIQGGRIATLGPAPFSATWPSDNLPRAAQARATQPTRLAALFREDFLGLMDTHARIASKIALQLAREMGRRIRHMQGGESQLWRQHL
jgi:hypothetical protein